MMKDFLAEKVNNCLQIKKLQGEASNRSFFRLFFNNTTLVAMVYPHASDDEIKRIVELTHLYQAHYLPVPDIKAVIDRQILLQSDLGDCLLQKAFKKANQVEKSTIIKQVAKLLLRLKDIPVHHTPFKLDHLHMKRELDFFLTHFVRYYFPHHRQYNELQKALYGIVERIKDITVFAHRDFHSRNLLYMKNNLYMVDFQDSLVAPKYYDLVSIAFDSYLDLKQFKDQLIKELKKQNFLIDSEQLHLTALQRNLKALGTFAYQIHQKNNRTYSQYINRTLRHLKKNPLYHQFSQLEFLSQFE